MQKQERKADHLEDDNEPVSRYRSLGEWDGGDESDDIAEFEDDDPSRRRDPLRKH